MREFNFFGEEATFHHLGVGVRSIKDVSPSSEVVTDPVQNVSVAFLCMNGVPLELVEPHGDHSPISESLEKGRKLHHICYTVPDVEGVIKKCRKHGFHCIRRPVPAVAFDNRRIAWVYSKQYGLVELLEKSETATKSSQGESTS